MNILVKICVFLVLISFSFASAFANSLESTQVGPFPIPINIEPEKSEATGIVGVKKEIKEDETTLSEIKNSNEFDHNELIKLKEKREQIQKHYDNLYALILKVQKRIDFQIKQEDPGISISNNLQKTLILQVKQFYDLLGKEEVPTLKIGEFGVYTKIITDEYTNWNNEINKNIQEVSLEIEKKTKEIEKVQLDLDKKKNILSGLLYDYAKSFGKFFGIIFLVWLFFRLIQAIIKKHDPKEVNERLATLRRFFAWIRNITIIIIVIIFFFSEFTQFLPFLAILGTALGFALRDIISSVIAWFVLGYKDSLYKVGDVIKIENEDILGKVLLISPTVTTIKEFGLSGVSGANLSFPNKFIFEKSIINRSRMEKFLYVTLDFLCEYDADFTELEKAIGIAISETKDHFSFPNSKELSVMLFKSGLSAKDLDHKIIYTNFSHGLRVRIKLLLIRGSIISTKSYLTRKILENINEAGAVTLRNIDFPEAE